MLFLETGLLDLSLFSWTSPVVFHTLYLQHSRRGCSLPAPVSVVVGGEFIAGLEDCVQCKVKVCNPSCGQALFERQGEGRNR